jgi:GAF domain-containing protein/CheY-like chemotaxis protein
MKRRTKPARKQARGRKSTGPKRPSARASARSGSSARLHQQLAIENTRLLNELRESLQQQTATADVLKVISRSAFDLRSVLNTLAESAARLCNAYDAVILLRKGESLVFGAHHGPIPIDFIELPISRAWTAGRVIVDRKPVHVHDLVAAGDEFPEGRAIALRLGQRTILSVPLLRDGEAIGSLSLRRTEVRPFSQKQIELAETFADQAVIAIENVRLFNDVQQRTNELSEALEQQTATSEVLGVISSSPGELEPVFDAMLANATRLCEAKFGNLFLYKDGGLHIVASHNVPPAFAEARRRGPLYPPPGTGLSEALNTKQTVHVADLAAAQPYAERHPAAVEAVELGGVRTFVAVPMLKDNELIGMIVIYRQEVRPFPDKQVALLTNFASQAVIAIENTRLLNELRESLQQQTATADVLKVISRSAFDLQTVFDTLVESAVRLCEARFGAIFRLDHDLLHLAAQHNFPESHLALLQDEFPKPPNRGTISGRAVLAGAPVQIPDIRADQEYRGQASKEANFRSLLAVPLLRGGRSIGAIVIYRIEPGAFADKQLVLLQTFADQAVIAIENVRLFNEAQQRTAELTEALEQQTATSEVLQVISSSPGELEPVFETMLANAIRICESNFGVLFRFENGAARAAAMLGVPPAFAEFWQRGPQRPEPHTALSRVVATRQPVHVLDVKTEPAYLEQAPVYVAAVNLGQFRTFLNVPMLKENDVIGIFAIYRQEVRPFTEKQIELVKSFANQAVIAIENTRLLNELRQSLQQQTATADVLKVISRSAFDLQSVFNTLVESAAQLCEADTAFIFRRDGSVYRLAANYGHSPEFEAYIRDNPLPPGRGSVTGRAALEGRIVHIPNVEADSEYSLREAKQIGRFRTMLGVPLLREGMPIGVITLTRAAVRPFTDKQIELVSTFADQAVIAIENVRLFDEVQARTRELARSVEELRALGEVMQAVNSTLDLDTLLSTIVAKAAQLSETDAGTIYEFDKQSDRFELRATYGMDETMIARIREQHIRIGDFGIGHAAANRAPLQIPDLHKDPSATIEIVIRAGFRALLIIPLLAKDDIVGALVVRRKTPGEFPQSTVELLQTFAAQSVLAIQNARLFREIEETGRQLAEASQHKSQFLANMSHELRTPLNAIIGVTEMLREDAESLNQDLEPLDRVLGAGRHLLALINDILDLSKIEAGRMELHLETFPLAPLIQDVAKTIESMATKNGNRIIIECPADLGTMHADQTRFRQSLLNLASNANKFTEKGTITIAARQGQESGRDWITLAVADTGIGMTPEQMGKLFQEFSQASSRTASKYGGTGLGLAISRHFCRMMGGDITVKSEPGKGSTFAIRLPRIVQGVETPVTQGGAEARAEPVHPIAEDAEEPLILVVDDDATTRDLVVRHLERAGFAAVAARGGQEGLRLVRELRPAAVTLDIMMPDLDGWTVLAAIKGDPALASTPVVLMSIVDQKNRGYALGAADYLVKPVDRTKLIETLTNICGSISGTALLVDDDEVVRRGVRHALVPIGWQVTEAENGQVAVEALATAQPDVIILDLMMPKMDGFEFLDELRSRPDWQDIPVVVITAKDLTEEDRARLNGGVERIIRKSDRDEMLRQLTREINKRVKRQTARDA